MVLDGVDQMIRFGLINQAKTMKNHKNYDRFAMSVHQVGLFTTRVEDMGAWSRINRLLKTQES